MDAISAWLYSSLFSYGSGGSFGSSSGLSNPFTYAASSNALSNLSLVQAGAYGQQISADQTQISGLNQLESVVSTFQNTMAGLETQAAVSPAQATSSNTAVVTGSAAADAAIGTYTVNVTQLATAQTVTSTSFADPSATVVGSGTLTIQLGTYDSNTNTFTAASSSPVNVSVTSGSLNDIATAINAANAGVSANVTQDAAGYHLTLTSTATGAANGFKVSVTDSDGTNTDTAGLSQLAYDPTAAAGAGKNLTQTQAAQDAAYTVNGVAATSASNVNAAIGSGLTASLLQVGSADLTVSLTRPKPASAGWRLRAERWRAIRLPRRSRRISAATFMTVSHCPRPIRILRRSALPQTRMERCPWTPLRCKRHSIRIRRRLSPSSRKQRRISTTSPRPTPKPRARFRTPCKIFKTTLRSCSR